MKKKILISATLISMSICSYSHSEKSDYIVKSKGDTTFCISVKAGRTGGNVTTIRYVDKDGNEQKIKGKKKCQEIKTYSINGHIYDLVPLKASKPQGYQRHMWRKIDGKVKVYDYLNVMTTVNQQGSVHGPTSTTSVAKYMVNLRKGAFYDVKKKNIEKYIQPFLLKCKEFKNNYKGEFSGKREIFEPMIKLYNELCAN
ncbi:hypothetical protein JYT51_00325 [Candidatus Amoebophilus asiaticus]|nr:hypothetical protein [Candidatus Amoebophilus asiaticus]